MRLLVITHLFPQEGHEDYGVFVARHLVELQRQGAQLRIYVPVFWVPKTLRRLKRWSAYDSKRPLYNTTDLDAQTVPLRRLPGKWFLRWDGLSVYLSMKRDVLRTHRDHPFDAIYGICWVPDCDASVRLARLLGIPAIGYAIGSDINVYPHYSKTLYRHFVRIARQLDATQAMGQPVADKINAISDKRTMEVAGVVDLDTFAPVSDKAAVRRALGFPRDRLNVLFVGHLVAAKGIFELVDACVAMRQAMPSLIVRICGDGVDKSRLRSAITEAQLDGTIELAGCVSPDEMHRWMQASDVLVLPSYAEGMPNVVMEAMACGLPVVATAVGGLPVAIGDCRGAFLVPCKDTAAFKKAVLRLLQDANLRREMGRAARLKAEACFGAAPNARKVLAHFAQVIRAARRAGSFKRTEMPVSEDAE